MKTKQNNKITNKIFNKLKKTISVKNFTKLLMMVVLLATYSCVQDTTEDLAPELSGAGSGSGEVKTLQAVLPTPTRTELGDSYVDAEGKTKYPVYWCEEDVLAVNGLPTTDIAVGGRDGSAGNSVAVFDLPLGTTIPYNIVYPYAGEDVLVNAESGMYPVVFQAHQQHTEGTFMPGSAPMYGWSNGFEDVHMHHLSAVLRFSIKAAAGKTVDLKYVSVSALGAEPIAGVFDVYCGSRDMNDEKTGSIVARKGAVSTVLYNFENDSYELTEEESVFYVVVPKGDYKSGFEVNFVSQNGEVCVRTFEATGDTKLNGGVVREFPTIEEFTPDRKMLLIGNEAEMLEFAQSVGDTFNSNYAGGVLLVSDLDMTDKGLKTIDGFTSLFEGRNHTIKGLTEPLFGEELCGTVSNLIVEGNIVEKSHGKVGLIARSLAVNGDNVGRIFNCAAKGSIVYENKDVTVSEELDLINIGGAVGGVYGGEVSVTDSAVDITINVAGPTGDALYKPCIGGVVGYACASDESLPVVVRNTSAGTIIWDDQSNSTKVIPFIGGVAGYVTAGTFTDNENTGILEIRESMYDLDWGGVIGAAAVSIERCKNKGQLAINETVTTANIGGVLGLLEANETNPTYIKDCENSGEILLKDNFVINSSANIGGVVAIADKGTKLVNNCYNSGAIEYKGSCKYAGVNRRDKNAYIHLGGVVGLAWSEEVSECGNRETANIHVAGAVSGNEYNQSTSYPEESTGAVESYEYSGIGGVIGSRLGLKTELGTDSAVITRDCINNGEVYLCYKYCAGAVINVAACIGLFDSEEAIRCSNTGDMLIEVNVATSKTKPTETTNQTTLYVSGIFGYIKSANNKIVECSNNGVVKADNCIARIMHLSGITSQCANRLVMESCSNSKDVVAGKNLNLMFLYEGGIISSTAEAKEGIVYPYCTNTGNVLCESTGATTVYLGGIFGKSGNCNKENETTVGIENSGKINFTGSSEVLYMGGYAGIYDEEYHGVEFVNNSSCIVEFNGKVSEEAYVGGYAGSGLLEGGGNFSVRNKGNVIAKGFAPKIYISGGFAGLSSDADRTLGGLTNEGIVEVPAPGETAELPTDVYLGGVVGYADLGASYSTVESSDAPKKALVDCKNVGEIRYHGLATNGVYIGGIVGKAFKTPIYNCNNEGKIVSTGNAGDLVSRQFEGPSFDLIQKQLWDNDMAIGGVVGETDSNVLLSSNNASIEHTCTSNPLKIDQWGAAAPSRFDIGGVVGRTYIGASQGSQYAITLANLNNNEKGLITIYGSPYCTEQTSSIDWSSDASQTAQSNDIDDYDRANMRPFYRMNLSGVVGRIHDHSTKDCKHFITSCNNHAPITVPDGSLAKNLNMAGVLADVLSSHTTLTSCNNNGAIKIENVGHGTSLASATKIACYFINLGGVVATCFDYRIRTSAYSGAVIEKTLTFNSCTNNAPIEYNENRASFCASAGGILGQALNMLEGRVGTWQGSSRPWIARSPYSAYTISMNNCTNTDKGSIKYYSNAIGIITSYAGTSFAGGIVGSCGNANHAINIQQRFAAIDLLVSNCSNYGDIQFERSNGVSTPNTSVNQSAVGGIVGYYQGGIGQVYNSKGPLARTVNDAFHMEITSCYNEGRIWGFSGHIGGIVGCAKWFVKITGTPDNPTKNKGDIVVARNASAGDAVRRTGYGSKVIYAGGIAGSLYEYGDNTAYLGQSTSTNEGWWSYPLGTQYARIEYAVNEGVVGATSIAGGIVGYYRSLLVTTEKVAGKESRGGIEHCINNADIYALEGATSQVGLITGSKRLFTMPENASYTTEETPKVAAEPWPLGVKNCQVAGQVLRGANRYTQCNGETYMNLIYGETWNADEFVSIVEGEENIYDGCHIYTPSTEGGE